MRREHFNHLIAAAAQISGEREIVVIGSQAILGAVDDPPESMLLSMEADIYPRNNPAKAEEIDASLGDGSPFQGTHGYYAHGVGPETAKAPKGWADRLVRVEIPPRVRQEAGTVALCMEPCDLVLAKCAAGRERDWDFARDAIEANIVELDELRSRIDDLPINQADREHVRLMLAGIAK
jgi:uncharacterized nucleotidyltransferase DUF6036